MALIESMACGCVPLANDHSGPKEIITDGINGFLCKENHIEDLIIKAINMPQDEYASLQAKAIEKGRSYHCSIIANRWKAILD